VQVSTTCLVRSRANILNRKNHTKVDNTMFKKLAYIALDNIPARLVRTCVHLSTIVEDYTRLNPQSVNIYMGEIKGQVRRHLIN
jgi:predicted Zn-dependent protease with MMP-like domain